MERVNMRKQNETGKNIKKKKPKHTGGYEGWMTDRKKKLAFNLIHGATLTSAGKRIFLVSGRYTL